MKKILFLMLFLPWCAALAGQKAAEAGYRFTVDLRDCTNDRLRINLVPPKLKSNDVRFCFSAMVPGVSRAMDFGQYVQDFQAFDAKGRPVAATRENTNVWRFADGKRIARISYLVDDTWDEMRQPIDRPDRPAGSCFIADDGFLLNAGSLFGFFEGMTDLPYRVRFRKPEGYYSATALVDVQRSDSVDVFSSRNFRELVDAPALIAPADTIQFQAGQTAIQIAVFSAMPGKNYPYAPFMRETMQPRMEAISQFLGDSLSVKEFVFLVYFESFENEGLITDSMAHSRSSLRLYGGRGMGKIAGMMPEPILHEYFHILAPLNLHSDIEDAYNFLTPQTSQHQWLYEGYTEYATIHMPIRQGTEDLGDFMKVLEEKTRRMRQFDAGLSLTELSRNAAAHPDQVDNVYYRGALTNLCLDLRLCQLSGGKYNLHLLVRDLIKKYGPDKPFSEAGLFDEITAMTYPEIRDFFRRYVEGAEPLPLAEYLGQVGINFNSPTGAYAVSGTPVMEQWKLRKAWIGR